MAKYFSFYVTTISIVYSNTYSIYYNEVNESNYAKQAHTDRLLKNYVSGTPGELPYFILNVEVPDSATSLIIKAPNITHTFPLVSTPPTVGTLFLTFDTL